jgi:hypothetical protein
METHVVTISVEFHDGRLPPAFSCELWRGNEDECRRLVTMISGCSHDHRQVAASAVRCGTIADWEEWVTGAQVVDHTG